MMKNTLFLMLLLLSTGLIQAQEKLSKEEKERREKNIQAGNPFAKFGSKAPVATLSKGKYLEVHDLDSIVTIGTIRWHVENQQIVGRLIRDTTDPDAQPVGDVAGRWMSPDPLSEEFPSWSPYNFVMNNPINMIDPDGRAPFDWFKGAGGQVVWFDNKSKGFTDTNGGKWSNVGATTAQVQQNMNIPKTDVVKYNSIEAFGTDGINGAGKAGAAINFVTFKNTAQLDFSMNVENTGAGGKLISGKSEITGINIDARFSTETWAPGLQVDGVTGSFGVKVNSPIGEKFSSESTPFKDIGTPMLSNAPFHATSEASLKVPLSSYSRLTNSSSGTPMGLNLKFNTSAQATTFNGQGDEKMFNISN